MRKRIAAGLAILAAGLALTGSPADLAAQPKTDKGPPPKHLYGHDLKVRKGGQKDFDKAALVGVELFSDETLKATVGISESGSLGVFASGAVGGDHKSKWFTGHDLRTRKAGELQFTQKTKTWGVEVFRDLGTNRILYVNEASSIAFAPVPSAVAQDRAPTEHHGLEPKVRNVDQETFENAKRFGVEAFKDESTGGLIYISETGAMCFGVAPAVKPMKTDPPKPVYGLTLRVRTADEKEFSDKTKKVAVEVFEDPNSNSLLYVSENGSIAVMPNLPRPAKTKGTPDWRGGMNLWARKGGEKDVGKAKKFGIEVFEDTHTGNLIFICETGDIAVMK